MKNTIPALLLLLLLVGAAAGASSETPFFSPSGTGSGSGDITGVTAGDSLSGGGASGDVTIDVTPSEGSGGGTGTNEVTYWDASGLLASTTWFTYDATNHRLGLYGDTALTLDITGGVNFGGGPRTNANGMWIGYGQYPDGTDSFKVNGDAVVDGTLTVGGSFSRLTSTQSVVYVVVDAATMTVTNSGGTLIIGGVEECHGFAISDETSDLVAGTTTTFRLPYAFTVTRLRASVSTAPVGSTIIIDIHDSGTTIMDTDKLSIDATEKTSTTAATAYALTDTALADDAEIEIIIDQIGSGTAGAGGKVWICGNR